MAKKKAQTEPVEKTTELVAAPELAAKPVSYIQDIMALDKHTANRNYALLVKLPAVGQFVGLSFQDFTGSEEVRCIPTVHFVQSNGVGYTRVDFAMKEEDFDALHIYAQVGKIVRQALVQEITWAELREAITVTLAEVISV